MSIKLTKLAINAKRYDYTAVFGLLGTVAMVVVSLASQTAGLPDWVGPYVKAAFPYATLLLAVASAAKAANAKPLMVQAEPNA